MKKFLCLLLCLSLMVGMIPGVLAAQELVYLALGDSITLGTGLKDGETPFPQLIADANSYSLRNYGINGMTASELYAMISTGEMDQIIADADLITITCGGNDLLALLYSELARSFNAQYGAVMGTIAAGDVVSILSNSADPRYFPLLLISLQVMQGNEAAGLLPFTQREEFAAEIRLFVSNLNQIMTCIREKNPDVPVIIPTQYNPYKDFSGMYQILATTMDEAARKLNEAIVDNAEAGTYLVADVYSEFQAHSGQLCNATMDPMELDFHPNAAGHSLMAQVFQTVIDALPKKPEPEVPEMTEPVVPDAPVIEDPVAGELFMGIGEYSVGEVPYLNGWGNTEYAAWMGVYALEQSQEQADALYAEFEKHYGFAATAQAECRYVGKFAVKGHLELKDVYHYTITDKTYTLITNNMYEIYVQPCTNNNDIWVGFCIYGDFYEGTFMEDPRVSDLIDDCQIIFQKVTGMTEEQIWQYKDEYYISYYNISVAGLQRTLHDYGPVHVMYIYCRGPLLEDILNGTAQPNTPQPLPTEPSEPEDPTEPSVPEEPTEPSVPEDPTEPSVPEDPTEPSVPEEPTEPSVPEDPTEPSVPEDPTDPSVPEDPTEPTEPSVPEEPTEPSVPEEPTQPSEPEEDEPASNPFTDVKQDDYFYDSVMWAVDNQITLGVGADRFAPEEGCSRAQVVTFLWRAAGKPAPQSGENPFTDVSPADYYYDAVLWAVENGITMGVTADEFGPEQVCTRAQVATFLWRAAGKPAPLGTADPFADVAGDAYYAQAVLWAVENQITLGTGNGRYDPDATCTRAQIVTFLYRSLTT